MRLTTLALFAFCAAASYGQTETSHKVEGGGISVAGWKGTVDPNEAGTGQTVNDAKFAADGSAFHVTTGPAITYWNPGMPASGSYTVKATFKEPKYMNLNTHPHPYGIVIGGSEMGTAQQSYLYCAAYGNGNFIVRGFGPEPFQMNGRHGEANEAVHKAAGPGEPVTQDIAIRVDKAKVTCSINGADVASYDTSAVVTAGKLKSSDGAVGLRFAHNTDVIVSDFSVTK